MSSPVRVLYVGSDREGRAALEGALEGVLEGALEGAHDGVDSNVEIRVEPDAESALSLLNGTPGAVDCIVSTYQLPGMDGVEFRRELNRRFPDAAIPFLLFVADGSEEIAAAALNGGVEGYVRREAPDSTRRLEDCLRRVIEGHRATADHGAPESVGNCREQLQWERERLEEIRRVVSHDLRSPLNVATGYLEHVSDGSTVSEGGEGTYEESIRRATAALDRLETFFDDLNALVRQGAPIEAPTPVDLAAIARSARDELDDGSGGERLEDDGPVGGGSIDDSTESPAVTLQLADDLPESDAVVGDSERVLGLFRELYRNAIEHGDPPVTIEVGGLPDGFYVEDDGPGIPDDRREDVLEAGVSDKRDQTGFGLAAVRHVAVAHGWDLSVQDGSGGGARFEFDGVTRNGKRDVHGGRT